MCVYPVVFTGAAQLGECSSMVRCRHAQHDDSLCPCLVCQYTCAVSKISKRDVSLKRELKDLHELKFWLMSIPKQLIANFAFPTQRSGRDWKVKHKQGEQLQVNTFINNPRKIHGSLSLAINQAMAWRQSLSQEFPLLPGEYIPCSYALWAAATERGALACCNSSQGEREAFWINKSEDTQIIGGR